MDALGKWQFFGISLIPFAVGVLLHLFFKFTNPVAFRKPEYLVPIRHKWFYKIVKYPLQKFAYIVTNTKRGTFWWKHAWIGTVFACVAIAGYFFGVKVYTDSSLVADTGWFMVGNSTVAPVIAGLVFGWPSGVIAGTIAAIFRGCMGGLLGTPTAIALLFSGCGTAAISFFIFKNKRPRWYFGFLIGTLVETFNIILIYLFHLGKVGETYALVRQFDFICIGFAGVSVVLTCFVVSFFEKDQLFPKKQHLNNISFHVQTVLFLTCVFSMLIMTFSVRVISQLKSEQDYDVIVRDSVADVQRAVDSIQAEAHALLPEKEGTEHLICAGLESIPKQHHVSTKGFVLTISYGDIIIHEYGQYFPEKHFLANQIVGAPDGCPAAMAPGQIFEFSVGGKKQVLTDKQQDINQVFYCTIDNQVYMAIYDKDQLTVYDAPYAHVVVLVPYSEIESASGTVFRISLYTNLMVVIILFIVAEYFVNRKIVHRVELMDQALEQIMDGNLDKELHIEGYNEFSNLSNNINLTVGALKNYAQEVEMRIDNELQFARDIQTGSVPTAFPFEKNYNIFARMEPAREVGGDFYDYYKMNNGRILFLIADVSGKGIPAAMFMMRARTLIKSLSSTDIPLEDIVNTANKDLCTQNEAALFVTAWIGILDPNNGELRYINAGHMNPLLKRHNGKFEEFKNKHNFVLAADADYQFKTDITYLEPGDEIVLYTDGVTEAQNRDKELYGTKRLIDFVNNAKYFNAKQLLDEISDDVVKYADGEEQFDDTTLLIMRYLGNDNIVPETAITLKARPTNASIAVNFVESILAKYELPATFIARVSIVVDELFANIAFYAYPQEHVGEATIQVDFRDECFFLTLIDSGIPFDPTAPREVDTSSSIDDRKRGGLGIFIVKKTMDELKYEYKDNKNILNLVKHLKNLPPAEKKKPLVEVTEEIVTPANEAPTEPKEEKQIITDPAALEAALASLPDDEPAPAPKAEPAAEAKPAEPASETKVEEPAKEATSTDNNSNNNDNMN